MTYYDQLKRDDTHYGCGPYAFLNAIKYDFGLEFPVDFIIKMLLYLEKIEAWLRGFGMYADIGFPAIVKYFEYKTSLKLKIVKGTISTIKDDRARILGFKRANSLYIGYTKDGKFMKEEIKKLKDSKVGGHFHMYKRSRVLETLGGYSFKMSYENLKYAKDLDLYYNSTRSIIAHPDDQRTKNAQKELIKLAKERNKLISFKEFYTMDFK